MSIFTEPAYVKVPDSSTFDLSRENKTTLPMGKLVPVFVQECVPKDHFSVNANVFVRTLAMIAPAYQRYDLSLHFFFVPYRLLWKHWEDFITGGKDGTFEAKVPTLSYSTRAFTSLYSFGTRPQGTYNLPPLSSSDYTIDELEKMWQSSSSSLSDFCSVACGSIYDYLGYPMPHYHAQNITITSTSGGSTATRTISVLLPDNVPMFYSESFSSNNTLSSFRLSAYCLIFKEWYKDENYDFTLSDIQRYCVSNHYNEDAQQRPAQYRFIYWLNDVNQPFGYGYDTDIDDGVNLDWLACASLFPRSWRKDYFTSALPWAQRGDVASVVTSGEFHLPLRKNSDQSSVVYNSNGVLSSGDITSQNGFLRVGNENANIIPLGAEAYGTLATIFNVNDVRRMFAVQSWLERNARGGSRYVEQIMAHFGVRVPDARLMRSEYLGGFSQPIQISSVEQTGYYNDMDNNPQPLGNLAGRGTSANSGHCFDYNVLEHGVILGIASVLPRASYQQGCSRFLTKFDKFDFYFPSFAHLGEQEVKNSELFMNFGCGEADSVHRNEETFGYQMRYAEYKCANDEVHGDMLQTQDFWHDGRIFAPLTDSDSLTYSRPALNQDFVLSHPSLRPFALEPERHIGDYRSAPVEDVHVLFGDFGFDVKARRPMPRFSEPKLVG